MSEILYHINPDIAQPWNDLPPLPINSKLFRTLEIYEQLGKAKAALAQLQGRSAVIPNQGMLVNTISLQEAKVSSEIENIFTTDDDLYKAYSDNNLEGKGPSKEVLKYREAIWKGFHYLNENKSIDFNYFLLVFQEIKQTTDEIRPDFIITVIKQGGSGLNSGQVIYTPPKGKKRIQHLLENLSQFLNDDYAYQIDPLLKMAIGHYQFEVIHPFRDGNGRVGRVLNINFLTHKNLLDFPILFLSRFILENKLDYYAGLSGVSQRGDWKTWILFMLKAIEETSHFTYQKINEIVATKDAILAHITKEEPKLRNPHLLVEAIFSQPFTKVKHLVEKSIYSENTARIYLNSLTKLGVLEKKEIEGNHYYLNIELYRILSE